MVQDLEEGVRTHKLDIEAKLKTTVRIGHLCISWLFENVADIIDKFEIGEDGRKRIKVGSRCTLLGQSPRHSVFVLFTTTLSGLFKVAPAWFNVPLFRCKWIHTLRAPSV